MIHVDPTEHTPSAGHPIDCAFQLIFKGNVDSLKSRRVYIGNVVDCGPVAQTVPFQRGLEDHVCFVAVENRIYDCHLFEMLHP